MKVKEAVGLICTYEHFFLRGAQSGKILHSSRINKKEHLEQFLEDETPDDCFFADLYTPPRKYDKPYTYPIIGIWVSGK